jgi:hypothetical protein
MTCSICQKVALHGIYLGNGNIIHKECFQNLNNKINECIREINLNKSSLIELKRKISSRNSITGKLTGFFLGNRNSNIEEAKIQILQDNINYLQKYLTPMELIAKDISDLMLDYPPDWKNRVDTVKSKYFCCAKCSSTYELHVHHIIKLSNGGSNKFENLQLLCKSCHSNEHGGRDFSQSKNSLPAISDRVITITNAINNHEKIEFLYKKINDDKFQKRVVTPTKITSYDHTNKIDSTLCLEGFCHARNEARVFALKRMKGVKIAVK